MSVIPNWLGATPASLPQSGQVNQFLGTHNTQILYAGASTASVLTSGATTTSSNGLYLAQSFTTAAGQTAIGYITCPISTTTTTGASLAPTTLSLYANSGSAPTGAALGSVTLTAEYAYLSTANGNTNTFTLYPLPVAGLTASTTYWLVLASTASSGAYTWFRSASASGASTSANGSTWAAQTYGFRYNVFDQTASGLQTATWEDSGARWTASTYNTAAAVNQYASYAEYTVAQGANAYVQSYRAFTYSSGLLTKVA
jgi:hypothetical protein